MYRPSLNKLNINENENEMRIELSNGPLALGSRPEKFSIYLIVKFAKYEVKYVFTTVRPIENFPSK